MFVLDTNVVSELGKIRLGKADANVAKWADSVDAADLYVSAITVQELPSAYCSRSGATRRRAQCFARGSADKCCPRSRGAF